MNNEFLYELQENILDKKALYLLYEFFFIITFSITVENIILFIDVFRFILADTALVFLFLIYFKCKDYRDKKKNRIIINKIIFFCYIKSFMYICFYKRFKIYLITLYQIIVNPKAIIALILK